MSLIGIMAAMPDEIVKLKQELTDVEEQKRGNVFSFTTGKLNGRPVVVAPANVCELSPFYNLGRRASHSTAPRTGWHGVRGQRRHHAD